MTLTGTVVLSPELVDAFNIVTATTISGTLILTAEILSPDGDLPISVTTNFAVTTVPSSGEMRLAVSGSFPSLSFSNTGDVLMVMTGANFVVNALDTSGAAVLLDLSRIACSMEPGQGAELGSMRIV